MHRTVQQNKHARTHTCMHAHLVRAASRSLHTHAHTCTHTCTPCKGCFQPATLTHCVCHVVELLLVNTLTAPTVQGLNDVLGGVPHQTSHAVHHTHAVVDLGLHTQMIQDLTRDDAGGVKQCREVMRCTYCGKPSYFGQMLPRIQHGSLHSKTK